MTERRFKYVLPDDVLRKMSRQQYKAAMHWLRYTAWIISKSIDWDAFNKHVVDTMLYGRSEMFCEAL